ncbi:MAG: TIGR04551 family protein, partial [Myxococcales bacterium]|nr:TIGR04551 family protein [Myxococcales bacterium]
PVARAARVVSVVLLTLLALLAAARPAAAQMALPGSAERLAGESFLDKHFSLAGYLRLRFDVFDNFDLDHGPTPTTGRPLFPVPPSDKGRGPLMSANMRLRLEPVIRLPWGVSLHARVDVLDNLVLGSTPDGLPASVWAPTAAASTRTRPPQEGDNSDIDSVRVKRAWGQIVLPFGILSAGRMGALISWGTGFFVNSGNCLDCDLGDEGDRIALTLPLFGHLVTVAFDFGAIGPTSRAIGLYPQAFNLDHRDDVRSFALVIARYDRPQVVERYVRAGRTVIQYGLLTSIRTQADDVPAYYLTGDLDREYGPDDRVRRDLFAFAADFWFGLRVGGLSVDIEAALLFSQIDNASLLPGTELLQRITARQFGAVARARYDWTRFKIALEVGMASGDSAPGFGVRSPLDQFSSQPGDLDGPQFRLPGDTTTDNFRFNPDYRIDLILWRRIIGAVSDAIYIRPSAEWQPLRGLYFGGAVITSLAMRSESTPSGESPLGVEVDLTARWEPHRAFEARLQYGVLFPLAGLDNRLLGLSAATAQTFHAILAFKL